MRSDLVVGAMKQVSNRFLLVKVLATATRKFHRPGVRIEDTTNDVLVRCGSTNPIADKNAFRISTPTRSPRSKRSPAVEYRNGAFTALPLGKSLRAPSVSSSALVA
jgi:hypothetical protein